MGTVKVSVNYKNIFIKDEVITCDINILNWVDEFVYNYFVEKFNNDIYFNEDSDIDISNNNI